MAKTQKNKNTSGHLGLLKARLAKLRRELITPKGGGGPQGEGFDVAKTGDARIGFVGAFNLTFYWTIELVFRFSICRKKYSSIQFSWRLFGSC